MQEKKKRSSWFCCSKQPQKISKDLIKPEDQILSYEDLCRMNINEMVRTEDLYFNKKYKYYCDRQRRMLTKFSLYDLRLTDFQPINLENRQIIKYSCPLCFRYFNNILKASCCSNYVCLLCCMDYIKSFFQNQNNLEQQLKICHFCQCENSYYVDVSEEDGLKIYTDSQGLNFAKDMKENQPTENFNKPSITGFK